MTKTTEKKVVRDVSSAPSVESVQEQVNALYKKFHMLLKVCERYFGVDIDRDGRIADVPIKEEK